MKRVEDLYTDGTKLVNYGLKKYVYDLISLVIIMFVIIASLRIFKVYDYSDVPQDQVAQETGNFLAEWLPYFLAMVMLNANLYQKGAFVGKRTDGYISVVDVYSQFVAALDGRRIHALTPFCSDYNDNALKVVRESIMHAEGLTYEQFIDEWEEKGEKRKALRFMSGKEMKAIGLTLRQRWAVVRARNYKVHGINVNTLLSSQTAKDPTNIGANEKQMATQNTVGNTAGYLISTFLMTFITIKDIAQWGWAGILIVIFKLAFIVARCFMSYFKGYNNITVNLTSHIARKTDILKEFDAWLDDHKEEYKIEDKIEDKIEN